MTADSKVLQGTTAWFDMVGTLMSKAAANAGMAADRNVSFVERYTDGVELAEGLVQGIRFDIRNGKPSFRVGVWRDEQADIVVEITASAARQLNALYSADPLYRSTRDRFLGTGEMRLSGDPSQLGDWLDKIHDPIVERTSHPVH